ncbi:unnamed protein product [Phytophthora fragariaefolia]|uniref:Unnamed protein product n=1 Tax=Phytophthora fragariaefolia TaxID=1490495 RepID=A0A9W6YN49_9STRA|nr:unnamed protein product [Phytophthora fragariaefolia]
MADESDVPDEHGELVLMNGINGELFLIFDYADYYYQEQGVQQDYAEYYSQQEYEAYYAQHLGQESVSEQNAYQYQYNYDTTAEGHDGNAGQDYSYFASGDELAEVQQVYAADQLTMEHMTGYYYDEQGELVGGVESPTNVFNQEAYWDESNNVYSGDPTEPGTREGTPQDDTDTEALGSTESTPVGLASAEGPGTVAIPGEKSPRKKKKANATVYLIVSCCCLLQKSRKERIQKRQEMLEKEEEERIKAQEVAEATKGGTGALGESTVADGKTPRLSKKKAGFVDRGKAKFQMKMRIVKAIKRTRMSVQIRILPKYQDSLWLPKFVDDLIRGIVRYKIKIFKDPPKKPPKTPLKREDKAEAKGDVAVPAQPENMESNQSTDKPTNSQVKGTPATDSPKKSFLKRAKTEKADRKLDKQDKPESSKSLV